MKALLALAALAIAAPAWAQSDISAETETLGRTTLVSILNGSDAPVDQVRMWLPLAGSPVSFKAQEGWTAAANSAGVVVFGGGAIGPGGSAKFGLISDVSEPTISWKALSGGRELAVGVIREPAPAPPEPAPAVERQEPAEAGPPPAVFDHSSVRAVPADPGPGSSVRLVGSGFGASRALDLVVAGQTVRQFSSDAAGNFVITHILPADAAPGPWAFSVRGPAGAQAPGTAQVTAASERPPPPAAPRLTVSGVPETIMRGESVSVTGTAAPDGTVTARILGPGGEVVTGEPIAVDSAGAWRFETVVEYDMPYGKYSAVLTDGVDTARVEWVVRSADTITVAPESQRYDPGQTLVFAGTALPDVRTEIRLAGPRGDELSFSVATPGADGALSFSYPTDREIEEGTYTLFATQGGATAVARVGVGQLPEAPIVATLDKFNYQAADVLIMSIEGPPSSAVSLLVTDPTDRPKLTDTLNIRSDGRLEHRMSLEGYISGTYTATLSWANSSTDVAFSVGLDVGSGPIRLSTTKGTYVPDEQITVVGDTDNPSVLVALALVDPGGNSVRESESVTQRTATKNSAGPVRFLDNTLRVPANAEPGAWKVTARSGNNYAEVAIEVVSATDQTLSVATSQIRTTPAGNVIEFIVSGADGPLLGSVTDGDGEVITSIKFPRTSEGQITQPWIIPRGLAPDTYTITVSGGNGSASAEFSVG